MSKPELARPGRQVGQAALETVALLPLVLIVCVTVAQVLLAGYTGLVTRTAARAASEARASGADGGEAARESVPGWLRPSLRLEPAPDGEEATLTAAVPALIPGIPIHLSVTRISVFRHED
jgi:hypothetical protein